MSALHGTEVWTFYGNDPHALIWIEMMFSEAQNNYAKDRHWELSACCQKNFTVTELATNPGGGLRATLNPPLSIHLEMTFPALFSWCRILVYIASQYRR